MSARICQLNFGSLSRHRTLRKSDYSRHIQGFLPMGSKAYSIAHVRLLIEFTCRPFELHALRKHECRAPFSSHFFSDAPQSSRMLVYKS